MSSKRRLFGGLLSGTSLDGVDALLLSVSGSDPERVAWEVVGFCTVPYEADVREGIGHAIGAGGARELARLRRELAPLFAGAFLELLDHTGLSAEDVAAVGSHGQTVWHEPPSGEVRGVSLQIDDPAYLAEAIGCPVVSDFRSRDLAAGGHGAPLVPWCDWVLLRRPDVGRALQNLGGMGNVTFLPRSGNVDEVLGFDTGPGVALLDGVVRRASGGLERWDHEGRRALRGTVRSDLLATLLADPFFQEVPPRSTGRERFGEARLDTIVRDVDPQTDQAWDDLMATLTALTVQSVVRSYRTFLPADGVDEVVLAGGGARNPALVRGLTDALAPIPVRTGADALGLDPDAREAAAFALLAWAHLNGVPGNLPRVTGARGRRVLGSLSPDGTTR